MQRCRGAASAATCCFLCCWGRGAVLQAPCFKPRLVPAWGVRCQRGAVLGRGSKGFGGELTLDATFPMH